MILRIDQASEDPLYVQIRNQIVEAIARGELLPGDGLPSVRTLASDLGINLHTVNKAYAVLRDEGYLLMRGRAGAFVAEPLQRTSPARAAEAEARLADRLNLLASEHKAAGGSLEAFLEVAHAQAKAVYEDPGTAGAKRDVRVLGLDGEGSPMRAGQSARTQGSERDVNEGKGVSAWTPFSQL